MSAPTDTIRRCPREAVRTSRYQLLAFIDCPACGRTHAVDCDVEQERWLDREEPSYGWKR